MGNRWTCNFCRAVNTIPSAWSRGLYDAQGGYRFPQLYSATYEIPAEQIQFYGDQNCDPVFLICICTSRDQFMLADVVDALIDMISNIQTPMKIGLLTYDINPTVYSCYDGNWSSHIVNGDGFSPLPPDKIFLEVKEHKDTIIEFLKDLPNISNPAPKGCCLKRVLATCGHIFKHAENRCGKILCFNHGIPDTLVNCSRVKDNKNEFTPSTKIFSALSNQFHVLGLTVEMFHFSDEFSNLKTLLTVHNICGGHFFHYDSSFEPADLIEELQNITSTSKWNIQFALRFSESYRVVRHFQAFGETVEKFCNRTACMEVDDGIFFTLQRRNDASIKDPYIFAQFACAYCDQNGKFLRIHTLQIPTSPRPSEVIENIDLNVMASYVTRVTTRLARKNGLEDAQRAIQDSLVEIMQEYSTVTGALGMREDTFPPDLALWPDMILGALKGVYSSSLLPDKQMKRLFGAYMATPARLEKTYAPALWTLTDVLDDPSVGLAVDGAFVWPGARSLSEGSITPDAVLLLDAGMDVILWVGQKVHPDFLTSCFGDNYDFENLWLEERGNNEESILNRVWNIIEETNVFNYNGVRKPKFRITTNPAEITIFMFDDATQTIMSRMEFFNFIFRETRPKMSRV